MRFHCPKCPFKTNVEIDSVNHAIEVHGAQYSEKFLGQVQYRSKVRLARHGTKYSVKIAQ